MSQKSIEEKIIELRKQEIGYKKIGKMLNVPATTVSKILINNGFTSHVKLPSEDVIKKIVSMYQSGIGSLKISQTVSIPKKKVLDILRIKGIQIGKSGYHTSHSTKVNHNYFDKIDTEHKAYWLGFLYADGYNNEKLYQIELCQKESEQKMIERFRQDLESTYKISKKEVPLNGKMFWAYRTIIYSKQISQQLAQKGCVQNKSLVLAFPGEEIVPKSLIHHFMRGYFDGDGCITGKKISIVGTKQFIDCFVEILQNNTEISKAGNWSTTGNAFQWEHSSKKDMPLIYDFLYKNASIYMERKRDRFLKFK